MFCIKCGTQNPDEAVYCKKCGALLDAEEETRVASRESGPAEPVEHEKIFSIGPTLKFVYVGYIAAIAAAIIFVGILGLIGLTAWIAVLLGLALLLIPAYYHFKQKLISYTLTDTTIEIDSGLISRTTRNIPLRRV